MKENKSTENGSEFILFKTEDESVSVDVLLEDETVWLTQKQMAVLFDKNVMTINEHIKNIYNEGELTENSTIRKFLIVQKEGSREVSREVLSYNLDVIISVGYRVKSLRGTQFRIWATKRLNEYIRKGFTMGDERLKNLGGGGYWKELLQRIRDIRASEKVFYRQVLDIYATSICTPSVLRLTPNQLTLLRHLSKTHSHRSPTKSVFFCTRHGRVMQS